MQLRVHPSEKPEERLFAFLRNKRLLLVLDNFEHLLDGVNLLTKLLQASHGTKLIVTSRERLRLQEEWVFDIRGLTIPDSAHLEDWNTFPAAQLFLRSARRAGYMPADADLPSIVRICQIVEGTPLAIELAAAWVRVMPCADIAREIERSLDILTTTTRNVPEKHRSMRAAFGHSWALLTGEEQAVFRRLSVFRGGFSREGAEQIAGATLAILASLVDKSLVQVDATGRYHLHELLRQYAADKLRDAGEEKTTVQYHLDYFLRLAEKAETHAFGREQIAWFDRLEIEFDNLRAVLTRYVGEETGLRLATTLRWFFTERSHWSEGDNWFRRTLAANPDAPASLRSQALQILGQGERYIGGAGEQALALARAANDRWNIAWSLSWLGLKSGLDVAQKAAYLDESLSLFRELNDPMGLTHTLIRRAFLAWAQDDYFYARLLAEEVEIRAREAGDRVCAGWASLELGVISRHLDGNLSQARTHLETGLVFFREARFQGGLNILLAVLAAVELMVGNSVRAQRYNEEVLISLGEYEPDNPLVPGALAVMARIARADGQLERAAQLWGMASTGITPWVRNVVFDSNVVPLEDEIAALSAELGESAFAEAWAAGQAMTREQAIAYALEGHFTPAERADESDTAPSSGQLLLDPLNARELEVLRLVASDLSNREIAAKLFITVNTVKWYLKVIFGKLDVANRAQAVARAQALGLLAQE